MFLDDILEELQLTHKDKPKKETIKRGVAEVRYSAHNEGMAALDDLDDAVRDKYENFIGSPDRRAQREKLTSGDDSDHGNDTSTADFALACSLMQDGFTPSDTAIIMCATRYREKFDEMRGPTTYLERTINQAIECVSEGNSTLPIVVPTFALDQGRISIPTTPPPPRDYVWDGRMVAGHAYVLGGFGGVSKSQAALQLGASIALGIPFGNVPTKKGCALLIFGEDDVTEITRRIGAYAAQENLS